MQRISNIDILAGIPQNLHYVNCTLDSLVDYTSFSNCRRELTTLKYRLRLCYESALATLTKKDWGDSMRRIGVVLCLIACLLGPMNQDCDATVLDDVNDTLLKLNPLTAGISGLIGQAKDAGNTVLQQRLEQLNGIIQLAIQQLNEAAKQRIADLDEKVTKQIAQLNAYVSNNLLQFDYLLHHNLQEADAFMAQRIDQFTYGVANAICSIAFLKTTPTLRTGETGVTTFKQVGDVTYLYLPGSCLAKYDDAPEAYLTGDNIATSFTNFWKGIKLDHVNASSALIQIQIPNKLLPDSSHPSEFVVHLKLATGKTLGFSTYSDQAVPLHICGRVPKLTAHLKIDAIGKTHVRTTAPYPPSHPGMLNGLAHSSTPGGNGNNTVNLEIPPSPLEGWDVDMAPPDFGLVYSINARNNHWDLGRLPNHALHLYTDGSEGDAWLNVAVNVKVIKTVPKDPCTSPPVEQDFPLQYGVMNAIDIHDAVRNAIGTDCEEARNELTPGVHFRVEIFDTARHSYGSDFLKPNVPSEFHRGSVKITLDNENHLTTTAAPVCDSTPVPLTD